MPMLGDLTDAKTVPAVADFARNGGAVVAIGNSARFIDLLGTPLKPALAREVEGAMKPLDTKSFFIPGSILRARVDNRQPLAYGLPDQVDMFFNRSQTFVTANATPMARCPGSRGAICCAAAGPWDRRSWPARSPSPMSMSARASCW
ncbi:hypothetical protein ACFSUK_31695 [Sphingobium scionense]